MPLLAPVLKGEAVAVSSVEQQLGVGALRMIPQRLLILRVNSLGVRICHDYSIQSARSSLQPSLPATPNTNRIRCLARPDVRAE